MLSLTHTLISLPFGIYFHNPVLIFLAAFATHFLADTLLHWNIYPQNFKRFPFFLVACDVLAGLALSWLLLGSNFWTLPVWAAIAGGNTPDILHAVWTFLPKQFRSRYLRRLKPAFDWHERIQSETENVMQGLISQIIVIGIALFLLSSG